MGMMVKRSAILLLALLPGLLPGPARAAEFIDWWLTPDQQGRMYFQRGEYQQAARAFEDSWWKATAFYKAGDFANAAAIYAKLDGPQARFHLGNSLAKQEKLVPAIEAYKAALELKPEFPEATFNLEWVDGLYQLSQKEYEDAGGTGGKLKADLTVFDKRGAEGKGEVSAQQFQADKGLSDAELQDMWMRRVQTTPGDFLKFKFSYQLNAQESAVSQEQSQ
jgi:Ca-activated chloride channel family protein